MMLTEPEHFDAYKNFVASEFACKHSNIVKMHPDVLEILQSIRDAIDKPVFISSGYRHESHPVESMKDKPGEHTRGMAVDVIVYGEKALDMIKLAQELGVRRIGLHQRGRASGRFLHLGIADKFTREFPPGLWTY